ncbi:MAG: UPF0280 family protein [Candidatus Thorarchaeota archaeon]
MKRQSIRVDETIATITAEEHLIPPALKLVQESRELILSYINEDPEFESSLSPVDVSKNAPVLIRRMAEASAIANVGPMASVAGAIAQFVVEGLVADGADHVIFDNGGDIAMYLSQPVIAGIYAGPTAIDGLGLRISSLGTLLGLCTSSGTVGHSFSYGVADAAIVYSPDVALADAVATRLGNQITVRDPEILTSSMRAVMFDGIEGVMTILGDAIGTCGHLPEVVKANVDYDLISKAWEV